MICPFRVGAEFTYSVIADKDGNNDYLQKEQRAVYPPCYEDECPYFIKKWNEEGSCKKIEDEY